MFRTLSALAIAAVYTQDSLTVDLNSQVFMEKSKQTNTTDLSKFMRAKQSNGRGLEGFGMNLAAFDYGCHCNALLTGKPFGVGRPVDPLDSVCKDYLGCLRCVKKQTMCQKSEFYSFEMVGLSVQCGDSAGSCERNQCECDAKFYGDLVHLSLTGVQYDFQYSGAVFEAQKKCKKLETRISSFFKQDLSAQCCGGDSRPMEQFNSLRFSCCDGPGGNSILRRRC